MDEPLDRPPLEELLRNAEEMYTTNKIPYVNSASMSVEEISATILQRTEP